MATLEDYELLMNIKGPSIELQKTATYIQWRVAGSDGPWANLLLLTDIQGLPGFENVPTDPGVAQLVKLPSETNKAVVEVATSVTVAQSRSDKAIATAAFAGEVSGVGTPRDSAGSPMSSVPGMQLRGVTTVSYPVDTIRYHPFEIDSAVKITKVKYDVTTAPASACYLSTAIYSTDAFWQPLALIQQVNIIVPTATGPVQAEFASPKTLPKGRYLVAVASEKALTLRGYNGGPAFAATLAGASLSQYFQAAAPYSATFKELAPRWTSAPTGANGGTHAALFDWTAKTPALESMFMLPDRQVVKGANVVVLSEGWDVFWINWDWDGQIKWQIDAAKSAGANTIRIIGDYLGVALGSITIAQYRARWRQVIDYCASLGMYTYVCGGDAPAGQTSDPRSTPVLIDLAKEINGDPWVIGFDIIQESYPFAVTNMATLVPAIRAVCDRKLTFSIPISARWDANAAYARNQFRPYVDFYDYHAYFDVTLADLDFYWDEEHESKPLLFGEFGAALNLGQSAQLSRYASVRNAVSSVRSDGRHVAGALQWAIRDQGVDTNASRWGMWTEAKVPRQYLIDAFKAFPAHR